jgi:hypothetical protein
MKLIVDRKDLQEALAAAETSQLAPYKAARLIEKILFESKELTNSDKEISDLIDIVNILRRTAARIEQIRLTKENETLNRNVTRCWDHENIIT